MGRKFRPFTNKEIMDSSELSKKRASTEIMKYAHSKSFNKQDINFNINYNTLEFTKFKDYSTFMDLVKIFQTYSLKYNNCCNGLQNTPSNTCGNNKYGFCLQHNSQIPERIIDGLKSHVYSDELIMYAKNCACTNSAYAPFERITNTQAYDNPSLYEHGHIFKVKMGQHFQFPAKIGLGDCTIINDAPEIKSCSSSYGGCNTANYDVIYPSQYNILKYRANDDVNNCQDKNDASCVRASQKQMDAFSVFPRHKPHDPRLPKYKKENIGIIDNPCGCGIRSKMHSLLLQKEKDLNNCCGTNIRKGNKYK